MMQVVLVGLGAGAAAALLLASVVSGSIAAIFLFYLAPLPILIAALGWSHIAGLIAAAVATAAITILSGTWLIAVPVIAFGAWWLGYCALLARPAASKFFASAALGFLGLNNTAMIAVLGLSSRSSRTRFGTSWLLMNVTPAD